MPLTEQQIRILKTRCNNMPISDLLKYVLKGDITVEELDKLTSERKAALEEMIKNQPNPLEQQEWAQIIATADDDVRYNLLQAYIRNWSLSRPAQNHLEAAAAQINAIDDSRRQKSLKEEEGAWESLQDNFLSRPHLEQYLNRFPHSGHRADIEQALWGLTDADSEAEVKQYLSAYPNSPARLQAEDALWALIDKENVPEVEKFIADFPQSPNIAEAERVLDSLVEWDTVKASEDVFVINDYLKNNPGSPFRRRAEVMRLSLKQREIDDMKQNKSINYEVQRLLRMLDEGIVSLGELVNERIITENIVDRLRGSELTDNLPDIKAALESSQPECPPGYTDVFFFGIPGTGKTCVLMGLACSNELNINLASSGGDYAEALQAYTELGKTPPSNPGDYVTTIPATVNSPDGKSVHKLNLVEMSGEEFAFEIARAERQDSEGKSTKVFTFEEMGTGATELLRQDNRKVFFLIIDPTVDYIQFLRKQVIGYNETTGLPIYDLQKCLVRQSAVIQKMVNLFENPDNADVMKRVDCIHIIVTKSDLLGESTEDRNKKALEIFEKKYKQIITPLYRLSKEHNINRLTNFQPKLFTFSLGSFYVGGMYEYDNTDSNNLVKAIRNSTAKERGRNWWDKLCDAIN